MRDDTDNQESGIEARAAGSPVERSSTSLVERSSTSLVERSSTARRSRVQDRWALHETTAMVTVGALRPADSPRLSGQDDKHVRLLATTGAQLPPILVHRPTMRVIDGMHRLAAAQMLGEDKVAVEYFEGTAADAFIRAVESNVRHGLPLSRTDREAAVRRIVVSHPHWSDRAIAAVTGLSPPTVGSLRHRVGADVPRPDIRIGRDGRVRPLSSVEGRRRASKMINDRPGAPLREIARASGVSLGTAHDVRERMRRGEDPVPARITRQTPRRRLTALGTGADEARTVLYNLRRDPSLRFTVVGRSLLQWLGVYVVAECQEDFLRRIPDHCTGIIADLARGCAEIWVQLAERLEARQRKTG